MEFDDIAGAICNPGRRAQPSPSDVHPARLAKPERPARVGGVQSGFGEKGVAPWQISTGNVEPKESAGDDLLADFQRIRREPDPGRVNDHCRHGQAPKSWRAANGSAWTYAGPAPAKLTPETPFRRPQTPAVVRSLQPTVRAILDLGGHDNTRHAQTEAKSAQPQRES